MLQKIRVINTSCEKRQFDGWTAVKCEEILWSGLFVMFFVSWYYTPESDGGRRGCGPGR